MFFSGGGTFKTNPQNNKHWAKIRMFFFGGGATLVSAFHQAWETEKREELLDRRLFFFGLQLWDLSRVFVMPAAHFWFQYESSQLICFLLIPEKIKGATNFLDLLLEFSRSSSNWWLPEKFSVKTLFFSSLKSYQIRASELFGVKYFVVCGFMSLDTWSCHRKTTSLENWLIFWEQQSGNFSNIKLNKGQRKMGSQAPSVLIKTLIGGKWFSLRVFWMSSREPYQIEYQKISSILFFGAKKSAKNFLMAFSLPRKMGSWNKMEMAFLGFLTNRISHNFLPIISSNRFGSFKKTSRKQQFRICVNINFFQKVGAL